MARKDLLKSLIGNSAAVSEAATQNTQATDSSIRRSRGAVGAVGRSISDLKNRAVLELEANLIAADGLEDRLGEDSADDLALLESIKEYGQQVPILVRPDPAKEGAYLIVYGRRRLAALTKLGLPVKAIVRDLDDASALMAQGQENSARRNLSFIEKARFGKQMEAEGYSRKVICDALSIDKTVVSRMFHVVGNVPEDWIVAIGAAPSIGRDRWIALAGLIEKAGAGEDKLEFLDPSLSSDQRFEKVFRSLQDDLIVDKPKPKKNIAKQVLFGADNEPVGTIDASKSKIKFEFYTKGNDGFEAWLVEKMPNLHAEFKKNKG